MPPVGSAPLRAVTGGRSLPGLYRDRFPPGSRLGPRLREGRAAGPVLGPLLRARAGSGWCVRASPVGAFPGGPVGFFPARRSRDGRLEVARGADSVLGRFGCFFFVGVFFFFELPLIKDYNSIWVPGPAVGCGSWLRNV